MILEAVSNKVYLNGPLANPLLIIVFRSDKAKNFGPSLIQGLPIDIHLVIKIKIMKAIELFLVCFVTLFRMTAWRSLAEITLPMLSSEFFDLPTRMLR